MFARISFANSIIFFTRKLFKTWILRINGTLFGLLFDSARFVPSVDPRDRKGIFTDDIFSLSERIGCLMVPSLCGLWPTPYVRGPSVGFESEPSTKRSKDISLRQPSFVHYNIIIFRLFEGNRRLRNYLAFTANFSPPSPWIMDQSTSGVNRDSLLRVNNFSFSSLPSPFISPNNDYPRSPPPSLIVVPSFEI